MNLRIAAVILALVVLPGIVFAVARDHRAPTSVHGWTAYASTGPTNNDAQEAAIIKEGVKKWEAKHPGGTCTITYPDGAECETAGGLPTDLVAVVGTTVTSSSP